MKVGGDFPPSDGAGDNGAEWQDMGETPILENGPSGDNGDVEASQEGDSEQLEGWNDELEAAVREIFDGKESKYFFVGEIKGLYGGNLSIDFVRDHIRGLDDDEKKKIVRRSKVIHDLYLINQDNLNKAYRDYTGISEGEYNLSKFLTDSSTDVLETVLKMTQSLESGESPEKTAASGEMSDDSGEAKTRKNELIEQICKMIEERGGSVDGEKFKVLSEEKLELIIEAIPLADRINATGCYPITMRKAEVIKKAGLWERIEKYENFFEEDITEEYLDNLKALVEGLENIDFSSVDNAPIIEASPEDIQIRERLIGEINALYKTEDSVLEKMDNEKLAEYLDYLEKWKALSDRVSTLDSDFIKFATSDNYPYLRDFCRYNSGMSATGSAEISRGLLFNTEPNFIFKAEENLTRALSEYQVPKPVVGENGGNGTDPEELAERNRLLAELEKYSVEGDDFEGIPNSDLRFLLSFRKFKSALFDSVFSDEERREFLNNHPDFRDAINRHGGGNWRAYVEEYGLAKLDALTAELEAMKAGESGAEDQEAKEKASLIEALTPTVKGEIVFIAKQLGLDGENATVDDLNKALEASDVAKLSELKSKLEEFRKKPEDSTGEGGRSPEELARREKAIAGLEEYYPKVREYIERSNYSTEQLELYLRVAESFNKLSVVYRSLSSSEKKKVEAEFSWFAALKEEDETLGIVGIAEKYDEKQLKEAITYIESIKGGTPDTGGEAGAESREAKEKAQLVKDLMPIDKTQISFVVNKLGLMGANGTLPSLEAIERALNGMEVSALKELKSQLEAYTKKAEGNGEADISPERLETLRKMTFGEWFHEVYGGAKSEKWPEDSFFAAPIEKQREAMARYMDMFDADARLEADRKYMVEELRRSDMMQRTMEEYNKDPDNKIKLSTSLTPAELEERFAKLSPDKLNKLYVAVFYGAKKGAGAASKPKPGADAQPKPGSGAGGGSGSGADGEPHGAPDAETGGGANDEPTAEPDSEKKPTVDELVEEYAPGNMPKTNDELLTRMKDVPDIKLSISRAGGEEAFASETMKHIQVWSGLPEVARRGVLERGTSSLNGDMKALDSVMYLQTVGFLPRTLYGN